MTELVPPMATPGPWDGPSRHHLYRNMLAAVEDLATAWHHVIDTGAVDVGDPADRHIAAARLARMLCARHRKRYGHAIPVSVAPCAVAVVDGRNDTKWQTHDHLLVVTDRAVADLGLAARCPIRPLPTLVAGRPATWTTHADLLMFHNRSANVTVTYLGHDRHTYRGNELWRRTNAEWADVAERLQDEYDRVVAERVRRECQAERHRQTAAATAGL
jgi:hypothetical protein